LAAFAAGWLAAAGLAGWLLAGWLLAAGCCAYGWLAHSALLAEFRSPPVLLAEIWSPDFSFTDLPVTIQPHRSNT
jgi:hypothetical protein